MITFKIEDHLINKHKKVVSIMKDDQQLLATITTDDTGNGIRLLTSHLQDIKKDIGPINGMPTIYTFSFK